MVTSLFIGKHSRCYPFMMLILGGYGKTGEGGVDGLGSAPVWCEGRTEAATQKKLGDQGHIVRHQF